MRIDAMRKDATVAVPKVLVEPTHEQVLDFCARDPVERVFLEDVARRGLGRFYAVERSDGSLGSLCHVGANLVPSGEDCGVFADAAASSAHSRPDSRFPASHSVEASETSTITSSPSSPRSSARSRTRSSTLRA